MKIDQIVWECLKKAITRFNEGNDRNTLLSPRVPNPTSKTDKAAASERAITHRLAFYLECELRAHGLVSDHGPLVVDCEYNRHKGTGKDLQTKEEGIRKIVTEARKPKQNLVADDEGYYVFSIAPDIVVHQRFTDENNLLVVEVKKESNVEPPDYDKSKLQLFTAPSDGKRGYGYKNGARVLVNDNADSQSRKLALDAQYQNGHQVEPIQ
jgi:hypothetical protein